MMLYTSPQLCAIMLGVIPPVAAWAVFFGRKVRAVGICDGGSTPGAM